MGMPGDIDIEITTTFDVEKRSVTRSVRFVDGWGLNSLVAFDLGDQESWDHNQTIVADTIALPDGQHKIHRQHVGPGQFELQVDAGHSDRRPNTMNAPHHGAERIEFIGNSPR
jgi:hypothetical protein